MYVKTLKYWRHGFIISLLLISVFFTSSIKAEVTPDYQWTKATLTPPGSWFEPGLPEIDRDGNVYLLGGLYGTSDLCPGPVEYTVTSPGMDSFISQILPDGSCGLLKIFQGDTEQYIFSITFDNENNLYAAIYFAGTVDFDSSENIDNRTAVGSYDVAIVKYSATGDYLWTKIINGNDYLAPYKITTDENNMIYIAGGFRNTIDFDPGVGIDNHTANSNTDIFVTKLTENGEYQWTKTMGGTSNEYAYSVDISPNQNYLYLTGSFQGTVDFDFTGNTEIYTSNGDRDTYITKMDLDGNYYWTKAWGGIGLDSVRGIEFDQDNNIYLGGYFQNTVDFNPTSNVDTHASQGGYDIFITKYTSEGEYLWTYTIGSTGHDDAIGDIAIFQDQYIILTGSFEDTVDFDPGENLIEKTTTGTSGYILIVNKNGGYEFVHTFLGSYLSGYRPLVYENTLYNVSYINGSGDFNPEGDHDYITATDEYVDLAITKFSFPSLTTVTNVPQSRINTNEDSLPNPNCISGWKYCIQFGNQHTGLPSFIHQSKDGNNAQIYIDKNTHHDDTYVKIEHKPINSLLSSDPTIPSIPFPWMQGYNIASPIWNFDIVSAFNGYTIPELDNPAIVVLNYDPSMLGNVSSNNLRIGYYDTTAKRWKILTNNTVLNEQKHTIANTSKVFGYMAVLYPIIYGTR